MSPGPFALALAAAFSGAALYVNLVEQPARLALDDAAMLSEWGPSERRGVGLMATLSVRPAALGLVAYFASQDVRWAIGALIILLAWPYTLFVMSPLNNQILALAPRDIGAARVLVRQWGLLEYGQTGIGLVACA